MPEIKFLKMLAKKRKIRNAIGEIYSQKDKVTKCIPIAVENERSLSLTPNGFLYYDISDLNHTGVTLKHMPFTNRHYFMNYSTKELLDLFHDLDPKRMKKHFYFGLEKKL